MKKTSLKFQNNQYKTVRGDALTRGTHVYILRVKIPNMEKVIKNVLTTMPKPHAHPHIMKKTYESFKMIGTKL